MTWRDPKDPNVAIGASCANLGELAAAYSPILRYDDREQIFPVLAESWLTHTTAAPWVPELAEEDDLPVDPHRRGTAICRAGSSLENLQVLGGTPNPADRPIQFSGSQFDPDAIGGYGGVDALTFLDFGGWIPGSGFLRGDADYLRRAFSELSSAMNPTVAWRLIEGDQHLPHMWVPQPVNPTVYAEAQWAGMYPRWSEEFASGDFPRDDTQLDPFLSLTYYYLYPLREPPPDGESTRHFEGQWEAISLFFGADVTLDDASGLPATLAFREPAAFVVISKGIEPSLVDQPLRQHPNEVRAWSAVEKVHAHPVIYVTAGTHRHSFDPVPGTRWDPTANPPPGGRVITGTTQVMGPWMFLVWSVVATLAAGAVGLVPVVPVVGPLLVWLFPLLLTLALLLVLAWIILTIWEAIDNKSGDPIPAWQDADEANGAGAQGGSTEEPPAGVASGPATGSTSTTPPGSANAGSPTGRDIVSFDVRLVDLVNHADDRTGFPSPAPCEHPYWWDYTGAWGVNVAHAMDNDWESGARRVDERQRSWSYWNALRLETSLHTGSAGP
jgi:hypothetical protein